MRFDYSHETVIVITVDIDWAPRECINDALDLLKKFNISPTIFATDNITSEFIADYDHGIHPNFTGPAQDADDIKSTISDCINNFPHAQGIRAHALVFSTRHQFAVRDNFPQIKYMSNHYIGGQTGLNPYMAESMLPELPIFFMDNLWLEMNGKFDIQKIMDLTSRPGLKVFDFHPYHLYINSLSPGHYTEARPHYHDAEKLIDFRREGDGARKMFLSIMEAIKENGWKTATCGEIAEVFNQGAEKI